MHKNELPSTATTPAQDLDISRIRKLQTVKYINNYVYSGWLFSTFKHHPSSSLNLYTSAVFYILTYSDVLENY